MSSKFFHSKRYKVIMNYVYGWGACAVIIGALFKIMHYPYAGLILSTGMIVEAAIFFLSAFEPQPESYKWSKVFPELSDDLGNNRVNSGGSVIGINGPIMDEEEARKIKEGISKLTETVEGISEISGAVVATERYSNSMSAASEAMDGFKEKSSEVMQNLETSVGNIQEGYKIVSDNLLETGKKLNEKVAGQINDLTQRIEKSGEEFERLGSLVGNYAGFIKQFEGQYKGTASSLNENMGALNALYEMQLKGTNEYVNKFSDIQKNINEMADNISLTLDNTRLHKNESEALGKNISNLNTVYGNMLSVLNNSKSR